MDVWVIWDSNEHLKVSRGTNQVVKYVGEGKQGYKSGSKICWRFLGIRFMSWQCSNLAL
jgi:hypothetical protein